MEPQTLEAHNGRSVTIDLCRACQAFWFDQHESLSLTPGSTLALFRIIGGKPAASPPRRDAAMCPRCSVRLEHTHDMQRDVRFEYDSCPNGHGRLTGFLDFLREKNFIRPLTSEQIAELRQNVQTVNCSNCGAPVDVTRASACAHCGSPLAMLDLKQAAALVAQLQRADAREHQPIDPALPLELLRARRQVEAAFPHDPAAGWSPGDLVDAGIQAVASWLKRNA
jgi:Zn-finger nucleic acid-binding protein